MGGGLPPAAKQVMLMEAPSGYISCFPGSPRITGSPGGSKQKKILMPSLLFGPNDSVIRFQADLFEVFPIRIRIGSGFNQVSVDLDPDLDPGGQKLPTKYKK